MRNIGVQSIGIQCPMFKEGDNLPEMVVDAVLKATAVYDNGYDFSNDEPFYYDIDNKDFVWKMAEIVLFKYEQEYFFQLLGGVRNNESKR